MKFLIISALLFSAYISLSYAATPEEQRDQLLRRARYLTTLVEGEVKILRVEGHTLQAEGLQRELEQLLELELELRVTEIANVTQTLIQRLDNNLNALETRIQTQLNALGRQFVTRQEIQRLINRTQDLIRIVSQEVKVLRAANRTLLATGLEAEEQRLIQLEVNLRSTQNPQEIRRLEELLVEADYRVWEILNGLNATRRALKDDVLKRADELINVTNDAIKAFQAEGNRTNVVALLNRTEREIRRVEEQLRSATNESVVRRLEDELLVLEFELSRDLSRFGKPITLQERRDLLVTAAQVLQQRANATIVDLQRNNRSADVTTLQNQLKNISALVDQLSKATTDADLTRLEASVRDAERALFEELQRLNRDPADPREVQRLLRRAEELAARVVAEIRTLIQQNRSLEAEGLRAEEQELILLDVELRDASTRQDIVRLEQRLVRAEERVVQELRALNRTKRALKDDVIKRADELINVTNDAIKAFQAEGNRTNVVALLNRTEREIRRVEEQLRSATNESVVRRLEDELLVLEFELSRDLSRFGKPITLQERRDLLVTAAQVLQQRANATIVDLQRNNRSADVTTLQNQLKNISALVDQLSKATTDADLTRLETSVRDAERALFEELQRLNRDPADPREVQRLLRRAEELAARVVAEIRTLIQQNRSLEAEGLRAEEQELILLDVELRDASTRQDIVRLEQRLVRAEERVAQELRALNRTKRALKDDVVKRAQELIAIAEEAITAFKAQNRTQAVQLIQRAEQQLQQAVTQLNSTTNATLIEQIQARVVRLEFELADDLRRLGRPIDVNERRDLLLTAAEELARLANAEINNLRAANRSNAIAAVEAEQRAIVAIVQQLRNATNVTQLTNLENQLAAAERRLAEELRRVEQPVITREERDALLRRAEELAIRILIEVRKLRDEGRILLAEGLYEEERHLIHLDAQIRTAVTPQEIARLESRLKEEEDHVSAELTRLGA